MSTLSLRLPESIHKRLGEIAEKEGISINQFINSAVAEKLAALMTEDYLRERGQRANAHGFDAVLAKIPDSPPIPGDEVPEAYQKRSRRRKAG
jgi:predicted transcriptional regulator